MDTTAENLTGPDPVTAPGVLGLSVETFRVLGRAVAEFAARASTGPLDEEDRELAAGLHDDLAAWGYVPRTPVDPDRPGDPPLALVATASDDVPACTAPEDQP